jgi:hypothetical protein
MTRSTHALLTVLVLLLGADVALRLADRPALPRAYADGPATLPPGGGGPTVAHGLRQGSSVLTASPDGKTLYAWRCTTTGGIDGPAQFVVGETTIK